MKSRSTSLALFFLASLTCPALAAPEDGQVRAGTADIERTGRITTIRQLYALPQSKGPIYLGSLPDGKGAFRGAFALPRVSAACLLGDEL